ncbi:MAG: DUF2911 domain-containing protein [Bacteroidota bacterium]
MKHPSLYVLIFLLVTVSGEAQQSLSPRDSVSLTLDTNVVSVNYGRPSMRGRKIMGDLVPWDKVWRTGANEATHFKTNFDMVIGGVPVPRGTYTLWTIPSPNGWKLILNKQTKQWGTGYEEFQDLARFDAEVTTLEKPVEQFTIALEKTGDASGTLQLMWENTLVSTRFEKSNTIRPISPLDSTEALLGGGRVFIKYSKPFMRGRNIWGVLVPMDSIWRTGANQATVFSTEKSLTIGDKDIPTGTYTLYSLPRNGSFELIISKKAPGSAQYDPTMDLVRVAMVMKESEKTIDPFTIQLESSGETGSLSLGWENRVYTVRLSVK